MSCTEVEELAGALALEAVPRDEAEAALDHLAGCPTAHTLLVELLGVAKLLPLTCDEVEPPTHLRARLLAAALATDSVSGPAPALTPESSANLSARASDGESAATSRTAAEDANSATAPGTPMPLRVRTARERRRWTTPAALLTAAAMLALAVGLAVWNVNLHGQIDDRSAAQQLQGRVVAALAAGAKAMRLTSAHGITATLIVPADGSTPYIVANMPSLASDKAYEAWFVRDGKSVVAGVFHSSGLVVLPLQGSVAGAESVAITLEARAGVSQPTGAPIAEVALSQGLRVIPLSY